MIFDSILSVVPWHLLCLVSWHFTDIGYVVSYHLTLHYVQIGTYHTKD